MHGDIAQEDIEDKQTRDRLEREANLFAGAFLIPRSSLLHEFYSTRVAHIKGLKARWRVSIQAIAHRAKEVGIIDESQYISFRKQISFHNWIKNEPLDDQIPLEQPQLLMRSWNAFVDKRGISGSAIEDTLGFTAERVFELFGRTGGTARISNEIATVVRIRE
jgi:Zn-dependent peptidase ImmA (M78 family)